MNTWLIAGTPTTEPYPCRCVPGKSCRTLADGGHPGYVCPCSGRTDDLDKMPLNCCTRRTKAAR